MVTITVDTKGVTARLARMPATVQESLVRAVARAQIDLQRYIRESKLHGQVLNSRSGNLSRAIIALPLEISPTMIRGRVVVDKSAPYGFMQEYGVAHSWVIEPSHAKALRFISASGEVVFTKRVTHPGLKERSFMRSALADKQAEISANLRAAVAEGIKNSGN